ncbi:TonB-dependent receptor domain-containing protein [Maribacter sp. 2307ULW6-5]|uniref:TonB-dependent receptor domain-containing protein n=1 Tax=Maribacter sp. 2307ULW6-5 TaxID=3386275 RepID=UPI0039BD7522
MRKSLFPLTFLLLLGSLSLFGQKNVYLTGTVVDQDTNEPLEFATLVVQRADDPSKVTGGITDAQGKFRVATEPGRYNLRVEYISYTPFVLNEQDIRSSRDLGTIRLKLDATQLEAVEVVGEKTTVEVRLDKKIYNIGKDITTSGGNVGDALNNVPSVTVDVDGAIALRGNSNVRILINGRPSALAGFGSTDALRNLPADAIESVEVITSPSARYDAEGTAGILNIILKKEKTLGLNGTVNASVGFPTASQVNTNLNLRTDKFNIFTTLGYSYREPPGNAFFDNNYTVGEFSRITEDRDILRQSSGFNGNLGLEYFLTENSSITGSVFGRIADGVDLTENNNNRFINGVLGSQTFRFEDENEDDTRYQLALNYRNEFNDEGHELTADLQYSRSDEVIRTDIGEDETFPTNNLIALEKVNEGEEQNEYLIQVDYVLPIGDKQFEFGYRGDFEEEITSFQLDTLNQNTGVFDLNENLTNTFTFDENVHAVYTQYGDKLSDKFSFLLGLRFENTVLKGQLESEFDTSELEELLGEEVDVNFKKNYPGLFPTLNFIYELGENENLSLGYNRRINRPRGWFINPFPSRSSRTNIFQGNPDLDPSFSNAFDLGYLKRFDKLTLTSSIYYQRETNAFERIQEETGQVTSDGIRIIRSIPINLSTEQRYGAEAAALYNPTDWLRLNGSFNFFGFDLDGEFNGTDFGANNVSWFARFSSKVTLPSKIDWQTNIFYRGPRENAQTRNKGILSINLAIAKDVFKEKGTVTLNVSDLLNSRRRQSFTQTPTFTSESEFQWRERQINLSFIYRINQKKQRGEGRMRNGGDDEGGEF